MTVIREYKEGDEIQLVDLYRQVFNRPFTLEEWRWKYRGNPAGEPVMSIAEDAGNIVGFYGAIPFRYKIGEKESVFYQVVDVMVRPEYRGGRIYRGMGKDVYEKIFERNHRDNYSLIYGFPGEKADLYGKRFLSHKPVGVIHRYTRLLNTDCSDFMKNRLISRSLKSIISLALFSLDVFTRAPGANINLERIESFNGEIDSFWDRVSSQHKIAVERKSAFLNWRYVKRPENDYKPFLIKGNRELLGYTVLKCGKDSGIIADLLIKDKKFLAPIFISIFDYFKKNGIKKALFFNSMNVYRKSLFKLGFLGPRSSRIAFYILEHPGLSLDILPRYIKFVKNIDNWFINFAELEL